MTTPINIERQRWHNDIRAIPVTTYYNLDLFDEERVEELLVQTRINYIIADTIVLHYYKEFNTHHGDRPDAESTSKGNLIIYKIKIPPSMVHKMEKIL